MIYHNQQQPPTLTNTRPVVRRGITLVELLMAIAITSMITAAVGSMISAVARSQEFENDRRESTIRAQALSARLASYIAPALCVLDNQPKSFVLWFDDSKQSNTVHGTEIRWVNFDSLSGTVELRYVDFPAGWSQLQKDEYDTVFPIDSDWWAVKQYYEALGFISMIRLSDGVSDFQVGYDPATTKSKKILTFTVTFTGQTTNHDIVSSTSIRDYQEPTS